MDKNKIVTVGEGCCLLCLELKQEFVDAIFINSAERNTLNIKHLIDKHLWTMKHIGPSSWLCVNCWTELYDFHNFYKRIENAHGNLELLISKADDNDFDGIEITDFKESPVEMLLDHSFDETNENLKGNDHNKSVESHIIEFNETPNSLFLCSPTREIIGDVASKEHNPLLDIESFRSLVDTPSLGQRSKLRKCKVNETNYLKPKTRRTCKIKSSRATKYLEDSTNNGIKQINNKNIRKRKVKSKLIENTSDIENFGTVQEPPVLDVPKKEQCMSTKVNNFKNETDPESTKKPNSRTKSICNEKDMFLSENFKITCFLCDTPFETFGNVLKHFKEQHKENGYIQCCNKKFHRRSVLIDHVNYHLNPNYFKCNQCDQVMEDRRRLELHCKSHEINKGKNFCCNTCGKGFIRLALLNSHKKIHLSEEEKLFRCHECGKNFASKCMLTNHCRQAHLKKYRKICEICGKSIQNKTIFERHMLQHEGKSAPSVSCDVCGLLLTDEKALDRHKKVIHPENGQKMYNCSICNKISPNLRNHKLHLRFTHESGFNYKCTICDKALKRAQSLKEHMASHTGETLYTCPWCPKTFNSNANMHNHRKKVHPKEWEENSRKRYSGKLPPRFKPPIPEGHSDAKIP